MSKTKKTRRAFIATTATGVAGVGVGAYLTRHRWLPSSDGPTADSPDAGPLTLATAIARILRVIGPWPARDDELASDFIRRFLSGRRLAWFEEEEKSVHAIAIRYTDSDIAVDNLEFSTFTEKEREFLVQLVRSLYATNEVQTYLRKDPPKGSCIGDITRYTRAPA